MDFQVVILAGGFSSNLVPLEVPKALLPVANRPVLSCVLDRLESSNLKDLIVVVEGEDAALTVGGYGYLLPVLIVYMFEVAAGALRAIAHHLTAKDILVDVIVDKHLFHRPTSPSITGQHKKLVL
ncbi:unnamed protein product [Brassica oleracea]